MIKLHALLAFLFFACNAYCQNYPTTIDNEQRSARTIKLSDKGNYLLTQVVTKTLSSTINIWDNRTGKRVYEKKAKFAVVSHEIFESSTKGKQTDNAAGECLV